MTTTSKNLSKPIIAVFDFDGTLTTRDTFLPFLYWCYGPLNSMLKLMPVLFLLLAYFFRLISNHKIKEVLLSQFFKHWSVKALQQQADAYALSYIPEIVNPKAMERLIWHKNHGHRVIIISANLAIYLRPWVEQMEIKDLIATELEVNDDKISGKIQGVCCYGAEKLKRLQSLIGSTEQYQLYVYGDSASDKEILAVADYPAYRSFSSKHLWIR